jgi:hypothetical protein
MTEHTLVGGSILRGVHSADKCVGEFCCIHNPSDHPMVEWDQHFIYGQMYRISPEGDIYPDPDSPNAPERPNAVRCNGCDKVIVSLHRHDYQTCGCPNGSVVDGGNDYHRRGWKEGSSGFEEIESWPIRREWVEK